jgi:CRISPR/Cas system-associated exonuclease Cas4 (RecB family)
MDVAITVAAALAVGLLLAAWALRHGTGVRRGAVDVERPLVDTVHGLRGRPDYIVREPAGLVPVEIKPNRRSTVLYDSDRMQLVAYMLLVRANHPRAFAGYGRVRYRDVEFVVPLTDVLEAQCLALAAAVRAARRAETVHRTHDLAAKCRACAVRAACDEALV